ncbi:MAG: hypothetical protein F2836_01940 [Actinobacteria bacterium]|uniref:Unannotated protein n=1 Tax=freshwater metagenome TaxID=449393 RepID=A0A6J7I1N9_9ZZZZ|nr:hypothetical protein [Actinomycetota bacterium]
MSDQLKGFRGRHPIKAIVVVVVIVALQIALPAEVTPGPAWVIILVELSGIPIVYVSRTLGKVTTQRFRYIMDVYFFLLICAGAVNAVLLLRAALDDSGSSGLSLLFAGFGVLTINVLSFGLIYWWIDGGGPIRRLQKTVTQWDFQFPQQLAAGSVWEPTLPDYLYVAYTNILAFSPTDAMPLTHRVKLLFTVQSAISVLTVVVTVGHAINVLST